jgi:hypothetical protein
MIQSLIAGVMVIAALLYSAWVFMPAAWRRAGAARLARQAGRSGMQAQAARQLQSRLERASACGECASCKGCQPAPQQGTTTAR